MFNVANRAFDKLAQPLGANDTTLEVYNADPFPDTPFTLSLEDEIMIVEEKNGTTFTVVRGAEGTTAEGYPQGTVVRNRFTAGTYTALQRAIVESEEKEMIEHGNEWHTKEFEDTANKGQPGGYASLDTEGLIPTAQLPEIEGMVEHGNEWHSEEFETVDGAQEKADQAEQNAKDYADTVTPPNLDNDRLELGNKFFIRYNSTLNALEFGVIK